MLKLNQEQQKEIKTIKERNVTLKLSDADCERLAKKCGQRGLTIGELFENFVGDLIDGTYSNGSDERMYANEWFNRCHFSWGREDTLLKEFITWGIDVEEFLTVCDEMGYYKEHPKEYQDEVEKSGIENLWFNIDYNDFTEVFLEKHPDADMEKEIALCRKWFSDFEKLQGETN